MQIISIPEKEETEKPDIAAGEHLVGEFVGDAAGVSLVVVGSIHGNEPSGLLAMRRVAAELEKLKDKLNGRVFLIAGNTRALEKNVRFIDYDLNRRWTDENVARNSPGAKISTRKAEDIEQKEMLEIFERIFSTARDEVFALDLHSTSAASVPFAMIGDTLRNRNFSQKFPAIFLLGIEEQLDGTVLEYINNRGAVTLGFEAGQHTDKTAVDNQEALIRLALAHTGILSPDDFDYKSDERVLREAAAGKPAIIEIRHRHAITPEDGFKMEPGYKNFQPVKKGEILAYDKNGAIRAKETGLILMPLYQNQGTDGFFLGRRIASFWLRLSWLLRTLRIGGLMRFLPGVKRHPADAETLVVNTNIARLMPLQMFHLLGFRKRRWRDGKLVVSRRRHDTISPFRNS
jgi:succinylglutamate desuccinylase